MKYSLMSFLILFSFQIMVKVPQLQILLSVSSIIVLNSYDCFTTNYNKKKKMWF